MPRACRAACVVQEAVGRQMGLRTVDDPMWPLVCAVDVWLPLVCVVDVSLVCVVDVWLPLVCAVNVWLPLACLDDVWWQRLWLTKEEIYRDLSRRSVVKANRGLTSTVLLCVSATCDETAGFVNLTSPWPWSTCAVQHEAVGWSDRDAGLV